MATTLSSIPAIALPTTAATPRHHTTVSLAMLLGLWAVIFVGSLWTPPLLDDADATHAQAAQHMLATGDLVTLHVNGVRYLEKPPLPYWIAALSLRLFTTPATLDARAAFAIHLPLALTVLGLALLGYTWSRRAFGHRAALYTALFTLTATGVFLFTRVFIPDALLSLLLALALYAFLRALEEPAGVSGWKDARTRDLYAYAMWLVLALAVLTKGLVALVLFAGTALLYLAIVRRLHDLRRLRPATGLLLFLAVAAPWHILAGLRNTGGADGHGFFWFYFVNEHLLRFLGSRLPRDYSKLPTALYWAQHLVWLFPWSLFAPAALLTALRLRRAHLNALDCHPGGEPLSRLELLRRGRPAVLPRASTFRSQTTLLLAIFSTVVLVFFSLSTNQEYYTFPVYLPLLMLLAAAVAHAEGAASSGSRTSGSRNALTLTYAAFAALGLALAATLAYALYASRHFAFVTDIGTVLARRDVAGYTLAMSHFFDLTGTSFAALRLPSAIAATAFAIGPIVALGLHLRRRPQAAIYTVALTSAAFLVAAHIALTRFAPLLSSQGFAATIQTLERDRRIEPGAQVLLYGDQAFGSSIPFYLQHPVTLVDGRSTSMLFGSTFPDVPTTTPPIFLTPQQLSAAWGNGARKILFVPLDITPDQRATVNRIVGPHPEILQQTSGKLLLTDRPLSLIPKP